MEKRRVGIIDYGMGNVWSVINAFNYIGSETQLISTPAEILKADCIVLPGVGSFRKAMEVIRARQIDAAIRESVQVQGKRLLGICLGMQLLGSRGTEDGETEGLALVGNRVDKFTPEELGMNKLPHVGFNSIQTREQRGLFRHLSAQADFYFVHSYRMLVEGLDCNLATCAYGSDFLAAFELGNICGAQFHPEKSQTNGLILLKNFLDF